MGGNRWGGGDFVRRLLLMYLLDLIDTISFNSIGILRESGKILWEQPLRITYYGSKERFDWRDLGPSKNGIVTLMLYVVELSNSSIPSCRTTHTFMLRWRIIERYHRSDCLSSATSVPPITSTVALQIQPLITNSTGRRNNDGLAPFQALLTLLNSLCCGYAYFYSIPRSRLVRMSHATLL